jgi:hypothetical protein
MARRVCIGRLPDNSFGLLISAPGVDVMTADPLDGNQITFNSNWTDLLKVHQIGKGFYSGNGLAGLVSFPALASKPFLECRVGDSSRVYDDSFLAQQVGVGARIEANGFVPAWYGQVAATFPYVYVVYKLEAPVQ